MAVHGHYHLALQGTSASRPATPGYDLLYYATDTGVLSVYDTIGAAWTTIGGSFPVSIANGGTGQTGATAAFNTLSPLTTKGDLILHDGTNNVRVAVGTNNYTVFADSGQSSGVAWRQSNISFPLFGSGTSMSYVLTGAYASAISSKFFMDFTRFRQARLVFWASLQIGFTGPNAYAKLRDTTNSQDITTNVTISSSTAQRYTTAWGNLNSATYAGDAEFDLYAFGDTAGDVLKIFYVQMELR